MRHPRTGDFIKEGFLEEHYIVFDCEAEDFINWLINDKKLSSYELIEELEYQINKEDVGYHLKNKCVDTLARIPLYCTQCNKITLYANGKKIYRTETKEHRDKISSSLVGGSNFYRKTTMTYITGWDFYCNDCLALNQKKYQQERESKSFKALFKHIFGKKRK